ncbi:hypothetical protein J7L67_04715, partial [bacterium]|nr:hypothetical protein [bacterium]
MNKKNFALLLLWILICFPVFAKEQPAETYSTIYDRIINPQKSTNVYIIKDVHCNYVIQKQIVNELENINKNMSIGFIAAEGSSGKLSFDILKEFPDFKILNSATDAFMKTADLMGVECFASNSVAKGENIQVFGLEDTELYLKNKSCFLDALSNSKIIKPIAEYAYSIAKNNILTKISDGKANLLKILYNNDTENLTTLVDFLKTSNFDLRKFSFLNKYYSLHKKLQSISREKLENESRKIHKYLKDDKSPKLSKKLDEVMKKYYAGIFSFDRFICGVNDIVKTNGLNIQTPGIDDYINLADEINRIDFYSLNEEINSISNQIEISVTKNIVPDDLLKKRKILFLVKKLYSASLKFNEYRILVDYFRTDNSTELSKKIYNLISKYKSLKQVIASQDNFILLSEPFIDFYNLASKRDKIMADKFFSFLPENFQDKSYIIVAGGYHTEGLSDILSEKGINHKIIIPKIPKGTSFSNDLYINRITGSEKIFDLALNQYFMGLQVWLNFSSTFPDDASRSSAELFRYKFISFLAAEAPYDSPAINAWLTDISEQQGMAVSIIAQNREGVICSIAKNTNAEQKFLFEISIDKNGMPLFRRNKYYQDCIDALYVEPSNAKLNEISGSIFLSAVFKQALMPGTDALNDLSRFMFMLRLNNPRAFYKIAKQISQLINENFPEDKIKKRSQAVMRFNLVLDEVEAANLFYENSIIALNEIDGFIAARRAVVETAYNINGSNEKFPLILDMASKQAELSISLLFMLGVLDDDWLIDHYFALFSWLVSQNSLTPDISKVDFPAQIFDELPPVQINETNLAQRIESGIDHIKSDKYNFNRALNFAQTAIERFSMPFRVRNNDAIQSPEKLFKSLNEILTDNEPGSVLSPAEFDAFMEQLLAEDTKILQPLLRATGDYSINLSNGYIKAVTANPEIFISTAKPPLASYYALSSLFAREGNIKSAREFLNKYIEEITRLKKENGFDANTELIDETAHRITLIFSKPWV